MISNKEILDKLNKLDDIEAKADEIIKLNKKLLNMLFEIDRKTLKPKLTEQSDINRW